MTHEAAKFTVVFLGPSLPLGEARKLLDAQYLPPASFGDVYRLIGSGVHTIILIDGVFHGRAPVWQRELCYAIQSGIRVYGASSMGALRAAELTAHGMVGLGKVFQWYATGEIDGDDEVALLHAGPEHGHRPLSMPFVNLRFNLREATARGIVEPGQAEALLTAMKSLPFWERTLDALSEMPTFRSLAEHQRAMLRAFFARDAIDLKQRDAIQALQEVARSQSELNAAESSTAAASPSPGPAPATVTVTSTAILGPRLASSYHDRFRLLKRTVPRSPTERLDGQALVDRVFSDPSRRRLLQGSLAARFFVREWAREHGISVAAEELAAMETAWRDQVVTPSLDAWLRQNGLTESEHRDLLARHLLYEWLLARVQKQPGMSWSLHEDELFPAFPDLGILQPICERTKLARSLPYVAAWCQWVGANPGSDVQALSERWEHALGVLQKHHGAESCALFLRAIWALEKGPVYFGYTTWSPAAEMLCELQITGTISRLVAGWESSDP